MPDTPKKHRENMDRAIDEIVASLARNCISFANIDTVLRTAKRVAKEASYIDEATLDLTLPGQD